MPYQNEQKRRWHQTLHPGLCPALSHKAPHTRPSHKAPHTKPLTQSPLHKATHTKPLIQSPSFKATHTRHTKPLTQSPSHCRIISLFISLPITSALMLESVWAVEFDDLNQAMRVAVLHWYVPAAGVWALLDGPLKVVSEQVRSLFGDLHAAVSLLVWLWTSGGRLVDVCWTSGGRLT